MNRIEKVKRRLMAALAAGLAGVILFCTVPEKIQCFAQNKADQAKITAWWGTIYPRFCFSSAEENNGEKLKISFWLAQALDW